MLCYVKVALCVCTGSKVISCTIAVEQKAEPIVKDAVETVAKVVDLGTKGASIVATCLPAGATVVLAAPCVLLETALVLTTVVNDITVITQDVNDIIQKAPGLKQEIQSCSAEVQTATSDVNNLLGEIKKCVDDYTSSAA
jgi:DeoR/GlpR family transcriptional regulator of sugar metabolism